MENANGVIKKLTSAERSYYTAAEVREMMGVSRDTAYRMIRSLRSDLIADGQLAKGCAKASEIAKIEYGAPIPEEYQSEVLKDYLAEMAADKEVK